MRRLASLIGVVALAGCDLDLTGLGCGDAREFSDEISATNLSALIIDAEAGDIEVVGRAGSNEVRVRARACSRDYSTTDDLDFQLFRSSGAAIAEAFTPSYDNARIDLTIEVPADFEVEIYDTSGHIKVDNVYAVYIEDGSGDIDVEDIETDFIVRYDTSGAIRHRNVGGLIQLP